MNLVFYRCSLCKRLDEYKRIISSGKCACTSRRFNPVYATALEVTLFVIAHPSYLIRALRGEQ
jgi:hypothetical protein